MMELAIGILIGLAVGASLGFFLGRRSAARPAAPPRPAPAKAAGAVSVALLDEMRDRPGARASAPRPGADAAALRQDLRLKCTYDEAKIDRLIDAERERTPRASLEELMQAAVARWERDNR
jgi:hypothetical protein